MIRDSVHNLNVKIHEEDPLNILVWIRIFAEIIYKFALFQYKDSRLITRCICSAN